MEPNQNTKPAMENIIKPIGAIRLLKESWSFFKLNWKILVAIMVIPSILSFIAGLATGLKASAIFILICNLVSVIFYIALHAGLIDAVRRLHSEPNTKISIKSQIKFGFSIFWSVLLLYIIQGLVVFGASILFLIPGIIVGLYVMFVTYARIIDGKKSWSALTESYSLIVGRWWDVFLRLLFFALVAIAASLIVAGVMFIVTHLITSSVKAGLVVSSVLNLVVSLTINSLFSIYLFKLYQSLKETRAMVNTDGFKKILKVLMIIGIVVAVLFAIVLPISISIMNKTFISSPSNTSTSTIPIKY